MTRTTHWLAGLAGVFMLALGVAAIALSYDSACPARAPSDPSAATLMEAVQQRCYGGPEVLAIEQVARPVPKEDELLVRVRAAAVNPVDWHGMTGRPYVMRLARGLGSPDDPRTGADFAGTVEAVGARVTRFKPGDVVFGARNGAFAEYLVVREHRAVAHVPATLTFEEAAAMPIAAVTALQGLRDHGRITAGQQVLINGASGGVGTYAVQIARSYGATVTGVCSTRNVELVRSLGADHVIDYTRENFTDGTQRYDLILDNVGNHSPLALRRVLEPGGVVVTVGAPKDGPWIGMFGGIIAGHVVSWFVDEEFRFFVAQLEQDDLGVLADLAQSGKLRSVIDRRFRLEETAEAIEYLARWRTRGKIILQVGNSK